MKNICIAAWLFTGMALSGCANTHIGQGPFLTEALAPAVADEGNPNRMMTDADGRRVAHASRSLREQQVDLVVVLAQGLEQNGIEVDFEHKWTAGRAGDGIIRLGNLNNGQALNVLITAVDNMPSEGQRVALRTSVASQLMAASNANCYVYMMSLRSGQVSSRLTTDLLTTGFGTVGSLVKNSGTAKRMAAYAGLSGAIGATIDRDIFAEQGAELIADAIVQSRKKSEQAIRTHFDDSYNEWPLGTVLSDIQTYQYQCTAVSGFSEMKKAVIARDETIKALRRAAAGVTANGGSAQDLLAIMQGFSEETAVEGDADTRNDRLAATTYSAAFRPQAGDLNGALSKARMCRDEVLASEVVVDVSALQTCNAAPGSMQEHYLAVYRTQLDGNQPDLVAIKQQQAVLAALSKPVSDENQAKIDALRKQLGTAYAAYALQADKTINDEIQLVTRKRETAAAALSYANATITAVELQAVLAGILDQTHDPLYATINTSLNGSPLKGPPLIMLARAAWQAEYDTQLALYR